MLVRDLMTAGVHRCHLEDALSVPAQIMWEHDCGCVPVVDARDKVVGIVTDRDLCMGAYTQGKSFADARVDSVCSHDVATCQPTDPIETAQTLMIDHQVRRLPVVDGDGRLVGLLSLSDLAQHAHFVTTAKGSRANAAMLAAVMEAVSRARGLRLSRLTRKQPAELKPAAHGGAS